MNRVLCTCCSWVSCDPSVCCPCPPPRPARALRGVSCSPSKGTSPRGAWRPQNKGQLGRGCHWTRGLGSAPASHLRAVKGAHEARGWEEQVPGKWEKQERGGGRGEHPPGGKGVDGIGVQKGPSFDLGEAGSAGTESCRDNCRATSRATGPEAGGRGGNRAGHGQWLGNLTQITQPL